ncbi:MAG: acetolactate synthase small subunit [Candidatus Roizmanbacteria bacterium]
MRYTIIAFTHNTPGVLNRLSDVFLRRKINVESLTVSETERKGISRFTITIEADDQTIEKIVKQLYRVIEVYKSMEKKDDELIFKEIAFIKVTTKNPEKRREVEDLVSLFSGKVIYVTDDSLVVEKTGSEDQINSLYILLKPFGIREFVRSGRIAVLKGDIEFEGKFASLKKGVSHTASSIEVSAIKRIELMARSKEGVISLAQGIPSFATPKHICDGAIDAINKGLADKYTTGYGIQELRDAISKKIKKDNNIDANSDQVIVTHGAIEALMAIFMSLMNPEDELVVLSPDYATHITQTRIAKHGGKPIYVALNETDRGWEFDPKQLEGAITQNTKAILVTNPCNPTGKVYTQIELKEIARIAIKYNLYIITDEIYEYFIYDGRKHISIGSFPEVKDRTITIQGVSKSYAMTGWRIGYIIASKEITKQIFKLHDSFVTCPTAVSQYAALSAIQGDKKDVEYFKNQFEKRRAIVMEELLKTDKLSLVQPEGAYYAFIKVNFEIEDYDFAVELVNNAKVAVVPGSAFGLGGENHLRISYGCEEDQLREGMRRLVTYVNGLV